MIKFAVLEGVYTDIHGLIREHDVAVNIDHISHVKHNIDGKRQSSSSIVFKDNSDICVFGTVSEVVNKIKEAS